MTRSVHAGEHRVVRRIGVARGAETVRSAVRCREPGMIERCTRPARRRMARLARRGESGRSVIRVRRATVIGRMACVAPCVR